tara:strand:+ start:4250 stop:4687 length:438 start_codon:yes stop_codon:yes gene_type:complete
MIKLNNNLQLREVNRNDWKFILDLRNRFYKDNFIEQKKAIEIKEHEEYMEKQNSNPDFHQWIAFNESEDVGYVRILDGDVNIMVNEIHHSKGIGTIMLELLEKKAKELGIQKLRAKVVTENESSKQIFLKNKYKLKMYFLEKDVK